MAAKPFNIFKALDTEVIMYNILPYLNLENLLKIECVCKTTLAVSKFITDQIAQQVNLENFNEVLPIQTATDLTKAILTDFAKQKTEQIIKANRNKFKIQLFMFKFISELTLFTKSKKISDFKCIKHLKTIKLLGYSSILNVILSKMFTNAELTGYQIQTIILELIKTDGINLTKDLIYNSKLNSMSLKIIINRLINSDRVDLAKNLINDRRLNSFIVQTIICNLIETNRIDLAMSFADKYTSFDTHKFGWIDLKLIREALIKINRYELFEKIKQ